MAVVAHAQAFGMEAAARILGAAADLVESQFPARVGELGVGQHHVAADAHRTAASQRPCQLKAGRGRSTRAEIGEGVGLLLLQRAAPQHVQQLRGIAAAPGLHHQLAVPVVIDAGMQLLDGDLAQTAGTVDGEAIGNERRVGFDAFGGRPVRLELERRLADVRGRLETAVAVAEWPVVQIARDQCTAVADLAANERAIEPPHQRWRHRVPHPETLDHRQRGRIDLGGDVDPWARAVALPPQPAPGIGTEVAPIEAQGRRPDAPARTFAPTAHGALQLDRVRRAEAARPVQPHRGGRIELDRETIGIAVDVTRQPLHAGCIADRLETELVDARTRIQRTSTTAEDIDRVQRCPRLGGLDPAPQRRRQPIAERSHRQQWCGVELLGMQPIARAARQQQAIELLCPRTPADAQGRRIETPATLHNLPAGTGVDAFIVDPRWRRLRREWRTAQPHLIQCGLHGHQRDAMAAQFRPGLGAPLAAFDGHPGQVQQR